MPLLPDEEPTGLQRVLAVADSGNGVSAVLPLGEWICLDAETAITEGGASLATATLSDDDGVVAHGAQSVLVSRRPPR